MRVRTPRSVIGPRLRASADRAEISTGPRTASGGRGSKKKSAILRPDAAEARCCSCCVRANEFATAMGEGAHIQGLSSDVTEFCPRGSSSLCSPSLLRSFTSRRQEAASKSRAGPTASASHQPAREAAAVAHPGVGLRRLRDLLGPDSRGRRDPRAGVQARVPRGVHRQMAAGSTASRRLVPAVQVGRRAPAPKPQFRPALAPALPALARRPRPERRACPAERRRRPRLHRACCAHRRRRRPELRADAAGRLCARAARVELYQHRRRGAARRAAGRAAALVRLRAASSFGA